MNEIYFANDTKKLLCPDTWRALLFERHDSSDNAFALVFPDEFSRDVEGVFFFTSCSRVEELPRAEIISRSCDLWESVRLAHAAEQLQIVELRDRSDSTLAAWVEEVSQGSSFRPDQRKRS